MINTVLIQDESEFKDMVRRKDIVLLRKKYPVLFDNRSITDKRKEFNQNYSVLKKQIIERDGDKCKICGNIGIQIDHVIPLANNQFNKVNGMKTTRVEGKIKKVPPESFGSNDQQNLRLVCQSCNRKKWIYFE